MAAVGHLQSAMQEDLHVEILLPAAEVLTAVGTDADRQMQQFFLQVMLALTAQRTLDEQMRVRWFRGPVGSRLVQLAGSLDRMAMQPGDGDAGSGLAEADVQLLKALTEGLTNREIAERTGREETEVARRLGELFARLGTPTRSDATAFAFRERVV
jgi:DNA-binding NarL/FixJ family response regulator